MSADIAMPQLGETVTEGTVTRWFKQVGDRVEEDEVLFEVSTDKVDSEVPSPAAGYVAEILVQEGETVDVGEKLAVISDSPPGDGQASGSGEADTGEAADAAEEASSADGAEADGAAGDGADGDGADREAQADRPEPEQEDDAVEVAATAEQAGAAEGEASAEAAASAEAGTAAEASGGEEQDGESPTAASAGGPSPSRVGPDSGQGANGGRLLSPVVRRLIAEHGLDPNEISGTGVGGRITRADVLSVIDAKGGGTATAAPPAPSPSLDTGQAADEQARETRREPEPEAKEERRAEETPSPAAGDGSAPAERDEVVPFSKIRRRTAEHMRRSLDTSTHAYVVMEVDFEAVDRVRLASRERFKAEEGVSLTYLPFVARAVVDAIRDFPHVNASVGEDELVVHHYVNLGIAVDLSFEGLIVPVVHDADGKRLRLLAREMADLATRARSKKLGADDISGGTFTITNPGGHGTLLTAPIINQPQVAILSTDGVKPKPVAVALPGGGHGVAVHPAGNLALGFDHRAYDGAYAAAFLARVRDVLETRDWSQELA